MDIAKDSISKMTDSNIYYDKRGNIDGNDVDAFINNFKYGWIAASMMYNYVECTLNTILRDCTNYKGERLLKANMEDKLEMLYMYYKADISILRREHWETFKKLCKVRNELTHFKDNYIGISGGIPVYWKKPFDDIGNYFTSSSMLKVMSKIKLFCKKVATDFGLVINEDVKFFHDEDSPPYVYDSKRYGV